MKDVMFLPEVSGRSSPDPPSLEPRLGHVIYHNGASLGLGLCSQSANRKTKTNLFVDQLSFFFFLPR